MPIHFNANRRINHILTTGFVEIDESILRDIGNPKYWTPCHF